MDRRIWLMAGLILEVNRFVRSSVLALLPNSSGGKHSPCDGGLM